nr:thrombospondin type 3 repeat-containing protein [Myxococcota bacterium]
DGVPDGADSCVEVANPDQRDTDSDGFGNACDPDYNNDGAVGIPDFNVFRGQFGLTDEDPGFDPAVDHNGDGAIGIPDFGVFRSYFGQAPGPSGLGCAGTVPCP